MLVLFIYNIMYVRLPHEPYKNFIILFKLFFQYAELHFKNVKNILMNSKLLSNDNKLDNRNL